MRTIIIILSGIAVFLYGCGDTLNNNNSTGSPVTYNEIQTINLPDNYTIKLYVTGYDSLSYAYNKVYLKVFLGSTAQNTGYIKVYPQMRMTPHITHSTPVSDSFMYNASSGYFEGFMIFNMPTSPPDLVWKARFTYFDASGTSHEEDSIPLYTSLHPEKQLKYFYDLADTMYYTLTLVSPFAPNAGVNDLAVMLHSSDVYQHSFTQITSAQMYINVYKQDSLFQTQGNINPVIGSEGIYYGQINTPHKGTWVTCDTIFYNGRYITNNPPPLPEFNIIIE